MMFGGFGGLENSFTSLCRRGMHRLRLGYFVELATNFVASLSCL